MSFLAPLFHYLGAHSSLISTKSTGESVFSQSLLWKQRWKFYHGFIVSYMVRLPPGLVAAACVYILFLP